ncbi:putative shikimate 5-dehydrogenase [Janibacter sp. HTCC2649]|uniref:shikimate dehydrogenase n=1 Tax=Janibacter sp. HTCC2649 TaxID=313589 RepID=UPI000066E9A5|nr:shikimate dehydrogenase [Janibacter sp. HTCC2649]EAP99338.1 putative shikimate 5-dehydrogenase [Janibacter sp. HTCC2649]
MRAGVLGSPVSHSLSPALHTAAYAALGLSDWTYDRREVAAAELAQVVAGLDVSWRGLSLTMPLKEAAFDVATTVTRIARDAGAINTLVRRDDGQWDGHNTDVVGLVRAVENVEHDGRATLLGSGATSRSAALALAELGVRDVAVAARNAEAAAEVVALLSRHGVEAAHVPLERWADERRRLVISTLAPAASAATGNAVDESGSTFAGVTLLDVVYADWPTPLARSARAAGADVISGLDMLVYQAAAQIELFTGRPGPVDVMFAAAHAAMAP